MPPIILHKIKIPDVPPLLQVLYECEYTISEPDREIYSLTTRTLHICTIHLFIDQPFQLHIVQV